MTLLASVGRWWQAARPGRARDDSFTLSCPCGHPVAGRRRQRAQVIACPGCGGGVFVLPTNPWLREGTLAARASGWVRRVASVPAAAGLSWWVMPLLAAVGTLAAVTAAFWVVLPRFEAPAVRMPVVARPDARAAADAGRRALAEGNYFLAERELTTALAPGSGENRTAGEVRNLVQLRRQAALLAALHGRSLQEILREALPLRDDEEWSDRFRAQHLGKAVVFDDVVSRDNAGRPALAVYRVRSGKESARVALEDLRLLERLPLGQPRRMLFGGRLASLVREDGGGWVFHFEPESGVLLTDVGAAGTSLGPLTAEMIEVLRLQQEWLTELATAAPR